jgi:plastocyanin
MNVRSALGAVATVTLLTSLAACGGGGDNATQAAGAAPAAGADATTAAGGVAAMAGNGAPGTGADAYKADDPFVSGNVKIPDVPKTIAAAGLAFTKTAYTAKPGEMWTFNNADIALHNVQSDDTDPNFKNPAKFKSPDAAPGKKVTFKMPMKKGTYHIVCIYHGGMTGTLKIK